MYIAIEIATAILETFILSIYLKGLYQSYKRKPFFVLAAYAVSGIFLCFLSLAPNTIPLIPFIRLGYGFLSFLILTKLLFDVKWLTAVYTALLLCAISIIVDNICSGIILAFGVSSDLLFDYGNTRIWYIVLAKLVQIFCVYLVIKLSQWRKSQESLVNAVPLLLCQVFSIFICYIMYLGALKAASAVTVSFIVGAVGILYINIIIFLYVERIKRVSEIKRQNELAEQQYKSKLEYFEQVKDDQQETRALWHDIRKYLNTMNDLMNRNDIGSARECIGQVSELFAGIGKVVDVGNTVVSAVLNHSVQKARRLEIETELDVRVRPDLNMSAADLSVIIGNTFDNAIEACEKLQKENRKISLQLIEKNAILFYEITNPFAAENAAGKKDSKRHGFGLKNVRRCVDKYKGTMNIDTAGAVFRVSIHMNIPPENASVQLVS
jgi:two-component system sensor histidine kinase AgrC